MAEKLRVRTAAMGTLALVMGAAWLAASWAGERPVPADLLNRQQTLRDAYATRESPPTEPSTATPPPGSPEQPRPFERGARNR
jgi:hypothetical protein